MARQPDLPWRKAEIGLDAVIGILEMKNHAEMAV